VSSDRVVRVIDQGRTEDGRVYVATEPTSGPTLEELVAQGGPLPVERAVHIVLQIGEALTEAQKVGVIHRNVSPRNVIVGALDQVKVAEFGLAEPVNGKVFGTAAYLSPEQVEGRPVDQRSNIYSLGATLYFALTGQPPFTGDAESVLQQHLHAQPVLPSSRREGLRPEIDRLILKALEKSGGRRHLTLRQLLSEIETVGGVSFAASSFKAAPEKRTVAAEAPSAAGHPRAAAATMMGIPVLAAPPAQQKIGSEARTVMGEAPPPVTAQPATTQKIGSDARTVMGEAPAPVIAQPATTQKIGSEARTVMGESPVIQPRAAASPEVPVSPKAPVDARTLAVDAPALPSTGPAAAAAAADSVDLNAKTTKHAVVDGKGRPSPAAQAAAAAQQKKGGFRETAWFKQGEVNEELARMEAEKASSDPLAPTGMTGKHKAIEDVDQVDVSAQDHARLSLKTGGTQAMPVLRDGAAKLPGDRMDESDMLAEFDSSRKWLVIAAVVVVVAVVAAVLWGVVFNSAPKVEGPAPPKPEAVAAAPPTAPVAATPAAKGSASPTVEPSPAPTAEKSPTPTAEKSATPTAEPSRAPRTEKSATPTAAAPAPVEAPSVARNPLIGAAAELRRQNLAAAVDLMARAGSDGTDGKAYRKLEASLTRALSLKAIRARKKHDRAGETEAKALLDRLKSFHAKR
jgi:serine/threonine-protein kinase